MNLVTLFGVGGNPSLLLVAYFVVIIGVMYIFTIRPQKRERARVEALINSMEVGDSVLTTSGFYGVVIDITGDDCIVEFGSNRNCRIPMKKTAIQYVEKLEESKAVEKAEAAVEEKKGFFDRFKK